MIFVLVAVGVAFGGVAFVGVKRGWFKKKAPQASEVGVANTSDGSAVAQSQDTTTTTV